MKPFKTLPIRYKLMTMIVLTSIGALVFAIYTMLANDSLQYRNILVKEIAAEADIFAHMSAPALAAHSPEKANKIMSAMRINANIRAAILLTKQGRVFAGFPKNMTKQFKLPMGVGSIQSNYHRLNLGNKPVFSISHHRINVIRTVYYRGQAIGAIYVQSDISPLMMNIISDLEVAALIFLVCVFLVVFVAARTQAMISRPILALVNTMETVSLKNDYSIRAKCESDDEIGILIQRFNKMLDRIQQHANEQKHAQDRIAELAYYDGLTGLPNRSFFKELLQRALLDAKRNKTSVAVLFLDLDNFKHINDTLGHDAGDLLLKQATHRLTASLRVNDPISRMEQHFELTTSTARLGGDEFTIILKDVETIQNIRVVAKRLIESLGQPYKLNGHSVVASASIGISIFPKDGENTETLLKNADTAMYYAKAHGKNSYKLYDETLSAVASRKLSLESGLRRALADNQLVLYYQPKYHLLKKKIIGFEALLRWQHPTMGLILPDDFIPLAEEVGLIIPIGKWVIKEALNQCRLWQKEITPDLQIAVNLSPRQFADDKLLNHLKQALHNSNIEPHYVELELTENAIMVSDVMTLEILQSLKDLGVKLSIDDFGTGYSSLRYLSHFPLDTIKIDRSFIANIHVDEGDASITLAIINLAHHLGLSVIAEGVETPSQLQFLKQHGCNEVQGYLISKPLPTADATALLKSDFVVECENEEALS